MFSGWCGIHAKRLAGLGFNVVEPSCSAWFAVSSWPFYPPVGYSSRHRFTAQVTRKFRNDNPQELPDKQTFPFITSLAIIASHLKGASVGGYEVRGVVVVRPLFYVCKFFLSDNLTTFESFD